MSKSELRSAIMRSDRDPRALSSLDKASFAFIAAALFLAPLLAGAFPTPTPGLLTAGVGVALVVALAGVAAGIGAAREWLRPVAVGSVPGLAGALTLLGGWAALSLFRIPALVYGLNGMAALLAALLLGGQISRLTRDKKALCALLLLLVGTGSLVAALTVREYIPMARAVGAQYRAFGGFLSPDFLAGYLLLVLPVTLAAFAATDDSATRLLLGIGTALQTAALMMTGSRAGILALSLALLVWLLLVFWSGAARKRGKPIAAGFALLLVCAALSSGSLRARVVGKTASASFASARAASDSQAHSGAFRKQTWVGAVRMAKANPIFGAGIGGFEVSYPRYTLVAFTAHAHNSFLQWTAETGFPGILFLLTALAAVAAFALNVLNLGRGNAAGFPTDEEDAPAASGLPLIAAPRLLLTGLLAALVASMVKSFIDSDWYLVATLFTLSAVLALTVGLARDLAPLATQTPRPLSRAMLAFGAFLALFLLWRGAATGVNRYDVATVMEHQEARRDAPEDADLLTSAAAADPFDPEALLLTASRQAYTAQNDAALASLNHAVKIAPVGKTYYRLGQFYAQTSRYPEAIAAFEQAQNREPRNVQDLRALGDALRQTGQNAQAAAVYHIITGLENSDFGKIRALPEMIEPEFVSAHFGLAQIAVAAQNWPDADAEYQKALNLLRIYWRDRKNGYYDSLSPRRHAALTDAYENALQQKSALLSRLNPPDAAAQKAALTAEITKFEQEKAADAAEAAPASSGAGAAP